MTVVDTAVQAASSLTYGELFIMIGLLSGILEAYLRASGTQYDSQVKYLLIVLRAVRGSKTVSKGNEQEIAESDPQEIVEAETGSVVTELDLETLTEESPGAKETEEMGNRNIENDPIDDMDIEKHIEDSTGPEEAEEMMNRHVDDSESEDSGSDSGSE